MVVFEYRAFGLAGAGQGHVVGFGFENVIPGISIENEQLAAAERTVHVAETRHREKQRGVNEIAQRLRIS